MQRRALPPTVQGRQLVHQAQLDALRHDRMRWLNGLDEWRHDLWTRPDETRLEHLDPRLLGEVVEDGRLGHADAMFVRWASSA